MAGFEVCMIRSDITINCKLESGVCTQVRFESFMQRLIELPGFKFVVQIISRIQGR